MFSAMHAKNTDSISKNFEGSFRLGFENAETRLGSPKSRLGSITTNIVVYTVHFFLFSVHSLIGTCRGNWFQIAMRMHVN